jgi:hypothetical protein
MKTEIIIARIANSIVAGILSKMISSAGFA